MPRLDYKAVNELIMLRFCGYSYREIGKKMKCSHKTVGNKFREFMSKVEEVGLTEASEFYNVKEQIEKLIQYGREIRKNELSVEAAVIGVKVHRRLDDLDVSPENFEQALSEIQLTVRENGYPLTGLSQAFLEILTIKRETGKNFKELAVEARKLGETVIERRQRTKELSEKITELEKELEGKLHVAETTEEELKEYVQNRVILRKYGVNLEETTRVKNLISNLLKMGYDPREVFEFYMAEENTRKKREENLDNLQEIEKQVTELKTERNTLMEEKEKYKEEIAVGADLRANSLEPAEVRTFIEAVQKISSKYGIEPRQAYQKFTRSIKETYDPVLDLENRLNYYESRRTNLQKEIELEEAKLELIKNESETKKSKLHEIEKLAKMGLNPNDLRNWNQIIEKAGLTSRNLLIKIEEYFGIQGLIEGTKLEHTRLQNEVEQMEAKEAVLEKNLARLQAEIDALNTDARESIQELVNTFQNMVQQAKELSTLSYVIGRDARRHLNIKALMSILSGERIDPSESLTAVYQIVSILEHWAQTNNIYEILTELQTLKERLLARLQQ